MSVIVIFVCLDYLHLSMKSHTHEKTIKIIFTPLMLSLLTYQCDALKNELISDMFESPCSRIHCLVN